MFFKKEILSVEIEPDLKENRGEYAWYCCGCQYQLPKTGKCFIIDYYCAGKIRYRYCVSHGRFTMYDYAEGKWGISAPETVTWYYGAASDETTDKQARRYFARSGTAHGILDSVCVEINNKKYARSAKYCANKQDRMIAMFPEISDDVRRWCSEKIFTNHIWLSPADGGRRTAVCENCGAEHTVGSSERLHKHSVKCPDCGRESIYFLERYRGSIYDKHRIHTVYRVDDFTLFRWTKVSRQYTPEAEYAFEDYYYSGRHPNEKNNFAYGEIISYGANYIGRKKWFTPKPCPCAYLYPGGLNEVYSDILHGIDIETPLEDGVKIDMPVLEITLREYPQTEYLLKMGLPQFIPNICCLNRTGKDFAELFEVNKQYYPLYRDHKLTYSKHRVIRLISQSEYVNPELIGIIKSRNADEWNINQIKQLFPAGATYGKILRYMDKQDYTASGFLTAYRDYIDMAQELGFELTHKYDIYPKDLRAEHDRLAEKVNTVRIAAQEADFRNSIDKLYKTIPTDFCDEKFAIVLPQSAADFAREGQNLKICVGGQHYIDNHKNGSYLICFIRRADAPEQSFVCCEINLSNYKITQIHGYKNDADAPLPKGTRAFAEKYAAEIKKFRNTSKKERKTA